MPYLSHKFIIDFIIAILFLNVFVTIMTSQTTYWQKNFITLFQFKFQLTWDNFIFQNKINLFKSANKKEQDLFNQNKLLEDIKAAFFKQINDLY